MQTLQTDVAIIGAGIVGLAIAERLSRTRKDIVVIEQHETFGRETSSRNSQVIHAGIYYPVGSLKAKLCVEGNPMLYEFCEKEGVAAEKVGKLIPGIDEDEVERMHERFELGRANGAPGLRMLSRDELKGYEPDLICKEAFFSPTTSWSRYRLEIPATSETCPRLTGVPSFSRARTTINRRA